MPLYRIGSNLMRVGGSVGRSSETVVGAMDTPGGEFVTANTGYMRIQRDGGASINVGGSGTEFTIEAWLRPSATASDNNRTAVTDGANYSGTEGNIWWDGDDSGSGQGFIIGLDNGRVYFAVNTAGGASARTAIGSTDIRDGNWHHIACYTNRSDGLLEVFVDGTRERTVTGPTGAVNWNGASSTNDRHRHVVGKEKLNITGGFNGDTSEIRVSTNRRYNGATYTVPTAPFSDDANTVGLYHFNENTGTSVADASGEGNTGTLAGSPVPSWLTADPFGGT